MNKILVSGLAIGNNIGACDVCNFDFEWIIKNPSALLWIDKLLVPDTIWETIINKRTTENLKLNEGLKLLFELMDENKLIEIIKPQDYINQELANQLFEQIDKDRVILNQMFPETVKLGEHEKCPGEMFINKYHYCSSYIWHIYATLFMAKHLNAQVMYTPETLNYCKYKFGASNSQIPNANFKTDILTNVFSTLVPVNNIFADFTFRSKEYCIECNRIGVCETNYLNETEKNIYKIFEMREADELYKVRDVLSKIVDCQAEKQGIIPLEDSKLILEQYKNEAKDINKMMKKAFPKVERFANLATLITLPICIGGFITGNPIVGSTAGVISACSSSAKSIIGLLKENYSWVGFINKDKQ